MKQRGYLLELSEKPGPLFSASRRKSPWSLFRSCFSFISPSFKDSEFSTSSSNPPRNDARTFSTQTDEAFTKPPINGRWTCRAAVDSRPAPAPPQPLRNASIECFHRTSRDDEAARHKQTSSRRQQVGRARRRFKLPFFRPNAGAPLGDESLRRTSPFPMQRSSFASPSPRSFSTKTSCLCLRQARRPAGRRRRALLHHKEGRPRMLVLLVLSQPLHPTVDGVDGGGDKYRDENKVV